MKEKVTIAPPVVGASSLLVIFAVLLESLILGVILPSFSNTVGVLVVNFKNTSFKISAKPPYSVGTEISLFSSP